MIKRDTFDSLSECFAYINDLSDYNSKVLINEYSSFDELQRFREEISTCFSSELQDGEKIYLIVASSGYGGTARIREHYKLWKTLEKKFDLSQMKLSKEQTLVFKGNVKYTGIAQISKSQIETVIDILYNNLYSSFAIISKNEVCFRKEDIGSLFINGCLNNEPGRFNYKYLFECLDDDDIGLKLEFDGEELALFSIKKLGS